MRWSATPATYGPFRSCCLRMGKLPPIHSDLEEIPHEANHPIPVPRTAPGSIPKSLALTCLKNATDVTDQISMDTTVAVPIVLPKDTILWRSPNYTVNISCWANQFWNAEEEIFFYLSPRDPSLSMIGPDLEVGLNLDGRDIRCTQVDRCRIKLPYKTKRCLNNAPAAAHI